MRIIFCTTIFMLFLGTHFTTAQTVIQGTTSMSASEIKFGVKAGPILADLFGDDLIDNSPIFGIQVGWAVEIPVTEIISFAPEILLSLQGAKDGNKSLKLNYMNLPLMGKYHITEEIAVEFGPQIGLLLWDNGDDFGTDFNTFDIGLGLGAGYRLNKNLYFQLRVNRGFLKVLDNLKLYNGALQLGAIYYF